MSGAQTRDTLPVYPDAGAYKVIYVDNRLFCPQLLAEHLRIWHPVFPYMYFHTPYVSLTLEQHLPIVDALRARSLQ